MSLDLTHATAPLTGDPDWNSGARMLDGLTDAAIADALGPVGDPWDRAVLAEALGEVQEAWNTLMDGREVRRATTLTIGGRIVLLAEADSSLGEAMCALRDIGVMEAAGFSFG